MKLLTAILGLFNGVVALFRENKLRQAGKNEAIVGALNEQEKRKKKAAIARAAAVKRVHRKNNSGK